MVQNVQIAAKRIFFYLLVSLNFEIVRTVVAGNATLVLLIYGKGQCSLMRLLDD